MSKDKSTVTTSPYLQRPLRPVKEELVNATVSADHLEALSTIGKANKLRMTILAMTGGGPSNEPL